MIGFITGMLVVYRCIPMLFRLCSPTLSLSDKEEILTEFYDLYRKQTDSNATFAEFVFEMSGVVAEIKPWIDYTLADMGFYANKMLLGKTDSKLEDIRLSQYLNRMQAQKNFIGFSFRDFRLADFETVTDLGCGTFPYANEFCTVNHVNKYIGVDKRDMSEYLPGKGINGVSVENAAKYEFVKGNFTKMQENPMNIILKHEKTFLLAESLHCTEDYMSLLTSLIDYSSRVENIIILEPSVECSLGFGLNFHMFEHIDAKPIDYDLITIKLAEFGFRRISRHCGKFHEFVVFTKNFNVYNAIDNLGESQR